MMRRFYIDPEDIKDSDVSICGDDAKHIRQVLRMVPGEHLILFDGSGTEHEARIIGIDGDTVNTRVVRRFSVSVESPLALTVAQGLLKDRKMDDLVRPLTELGATRWIPFTADRTVPRLDDKKRRIRHERWEKISREALKQCGRSRSPVIERVMAFDEMLAAAATAELRLFFWERAEAGMPERPGGGDGLPRAVSIVLGPEGGFNEHEAARAQAAGFHLVSLGPRILRAETAAVTACALAQFRYGDMASGFPKIA